MESTEDRGFLFANGIAMAAVVGLIVWFCVWFLRKESFAYTHYPIRFNRKNRKVYVWRTNGTVLTIPWDDVFFTLAWLRGEWEVRGHVLADDKSTVLESFALSYRDIPNSRDLDPATTQFSDRDFLRSHWEFVRRYMEEGPEVVSEQVQFCIPLDGRRETAIGGMHRVFAEFSGSSWITLLVMAPFCLAVSLGRVLAMRTGKIPSWPQDVEQACGIAEGDPYAIVGDADGNRVAVYPAAAEAAGVKFTARAAAPV